MAVDPETGAEIADDGETVSAGSRVNLSTLPTDPNGGQQPTQTTTSGPVPTLAQPAAAPQGSPTGAPITKVSGEYRGMTDAGLKRSGGLFGQADQAIDRFTQQDNAVAAGQQATSARHFGNLEAATGGEVDATKKFQADDQALQQKIVDFNNHAADLEQRLSGEAKAERQRYLSSYQEQLAGVRQLAMESGNPIGKLAPSSAGGLMGAQFAQGFLAARGINIDVSGQIDRWVDRSIQEHQQQIQNMRASADDQLHLYEIARQSSQDDWEARQRYRGFVIQGLQTSVQMNAARFQSDIAIAHAKEQVAKLQIEGDATERSIGDAHFNRVHAMMTTEYQKAHMMGSLAIEQQKLALETAKAKAAKPEKLPAYVTDPTQYAIDPKTGKRTTGGKIVAVFNPDAPGVTKAAENISAASTYHGNIVKGVDRLRELRTDKSGGEFWNSTTSAGYRRFDAARNELIADLLLANSGKAVTDAEFQRYKNMLADDKAWQSGKNASLLGELQVSSRRKLNAVVQGEEAAGNIRTLRGDEPIDPRFGADSGRHMPFEPDLDPATKAVDDADLHGGAPVLTPVAGDVDLANAKSGKPRPPSQLWNALTGGGHDKYVYDDRHNAVDWLARMAADPAGYRAIHDEAAKDDPKATEIPDKDDALVAEAISGLQKLAQDSKQEDIRKHAIAVLNLYQSNPAALKELVQEPDDKSNVPDNYWQAAGNPENEPGHKDEPSLTQTPFFTRPR